jgi:hypothetical protein
MKKMKYNRKKTFADLFYGISNEMPGENPENYLKNPIHFPKLGKRKERNDIPQPGSSKENLTPPRKRKFEKKETQIPPGFKHSHKIDENDVILNCLKNLIQNLNIPITWKDFIWNFIVPYIHQILANITASLLGSFVNINSETSDQI